MKVIKCDICGVEIKSSSEYHDSNLKIDFCPTCASRKLSPMLKEWNSIMKEHENQLKIATENLIRRYSVDA